MWVQANWDRIFNDRLCSTSSINRIMSKNTWMIWVNNKSLGKGSFIWIRGIRLRSMCRSRIVMFRRRRENMCLDCIREGVWMLRIFKGLRPSDWYLLISHFEILWRLTIFRIFTLACLTTETLTKTTHSTTLTQISAEDKSEKWSTPLFTTTNPSKKQKASPNSPSAILNNSTQKKSTSAETKTDPQTYSSETNQNEFRIYFRETDFQKPTNLWLKLETSVQLPILIKSNDQSLKKEDCPVKLLNWKDKPN